MKNRTGTNTVIHFGLLSPSLSSQLSEQGLRLDKASTQRFADDANAVTRLLLRGVMTDAEAKRCRRRLYMAICRRVK